MALILPESGSHRNGYFLIWTAAPSVVAMNDVVICEPLRTPVGRFGGALSSLSAVDLASVTLTELVRRTGLGEGDVDDVVLGQGYPNGESPAIGRIAALADGLRTRVTRTPV